MKQKNKLLNFTINQWNKMSDEQKREISANMTPSEVNEFLSMHSERMNKLSSKIDKREKKRSKKLKEKRKKQNLVLM